MPLSFFVDMQNGIYYQQIEDIIMTKINFISIIMMLLICIINAAHISVAGNFNPFAADENQLETTDESHQSLETSETIIEQAGPSLDLIDPHPHSHDDEDSSIIESAKRSLTQLSIDFLDAQLHGGEEHIHNEKNQTDNEAADLNDFKRWLEEQNQTNQLSRFLLLQIEINQFHFDDTKDLNDKLNRTIEELKLEKQQPKSEL